MSTLSITIGQQANPPNSAPRALTVGGSVSVQPSSGHRLVGTIHVSVTFGFTNQSVAATVTGSSWTCTGLPLAGVHPNDVVSVTATGSATLFFGLPGDPSDEEIQGSASAGAQMGPATPPTIAFNPITSPVVTDQLPVSIRFSGTAFGNDAPMSIMQYMADSGIAGGGFPSPNNDGNNYANWSVTLPVPPGQHTVMVRGMDRFGTFGAPNPDHFTVNVQRQTPVPPGTPTTIEGAPTSSSITSWTRLEPQSRGADIAMSSRARVFDPLWMLTRQWQMGEFQAEDAGSPVQARVRASNGKLSRCQIGAIPTSAVQAPAYDPAVTPLETIVERRRMRANDEKDPRMLSFAVEAGLHFLHMLDLAGLSKSYRPVFITRLALQQPVPATGTSIDDATNRYVQSMIGRAPDGRVLSTLLRTIGPAQLVLDATLKIAAADQPKIQKAALAWLAWYDSLYSEPASATDDGWDPSRLEYSMSVGTRLSANAQDDLTLSATEVDGSPLDWSSFDRNASAGLGTSNDTGFTSTAIATVPSPVSFAGAPAPRFWEMEDGNVAYGLVPVGPTDIAHLLMIEYASTYGNDWFVVPMTSPVGSVTRVDSLVVTDTFGVRSLLRPIGDPAISATPYFSMWQSFDATVPTTTNSPRVMSNRFFLPPTLSRTLDGAPVEDVLFMRDEMANVAWAIERSVESPIERPAQRYEAIDGASPDPITATTLPRYLLSSTVPPNWIPLLPVKPSDTDPRQSLLRRGAVLQPDGTGITHSAVGEVLNAAPNLLVYDEEVPREGARITRQRRMTRWTDGSTWVWTSLRNQVGNGEGSSALQFDQVLEPSDASAP
jgi:hypothetical protein